MASSSGKSYNFKTGFNPSLYTTWYEANITTLESAFSAIDMGDTLIDADSPIYFEKEHFVPNYLYPAMSIEGRENSRIREYCSTLILRMNSFFNDERYKILFDNYYLDHFWF